jgi:general secretion pathway protein G
MLPRRFVRYVRLSSVTFLKAIKIIFAPAMTPLIQLIAGLGFVISLCVVVLGFFGGRPMGDAGLARYVSGTVQVEAFAKAVERYREDCGEYPSASDGLNALVVDPGVEGWGGPYLRQDIPLDPWGRPYIYLLSAGSALETLSYGADGKPGGEGFDADISSRNPRHSIPESPWVVRVRRLWIGIWVGAWFCLFGSVFVLRRTSRSHNS